MCAKCKFITELSVYKVLLCFTLLPGGVTVYLDKKLPQVPFNRLYVADKYGVVCFT